MKGWQALTGTWKRPIMPTPPEIKRLKPVKERKGRPTLLTRDELILLRDMDELVSKTIEARSELLKKLGLNAQQAIAQRFKARKLCQPGS